MRQYIQNTGHHTRALAPKSCAALLLYFQHNQAVAEVMEQNSMKSAMMITSSTFQIEQKQMHRGCAVLRSNDTLVR